MSDDNVLVESIVGACRGMLEADQPVESVIRHAIDKAWDEGRQEGYDEGLREGLNGAAEEVAA